MLKGLRVCMLALLASACTAGLNKGPVRASAGKAVNESEATSPRPADTPEVRPFGAGMTRPMRLSGPLPHYTPEAFAAGVQGLMILKCVITTEGSVTRCRIIKPLPLMRDAVLVALYQTRYEPVTFQSRRVHADYAFNIRLALPKKITPPSSDSKPEASLLAEAFGEQGVKIHEENLRQKARFLCKHQMLEVPVVSRLPGDVDPAYLIRQEDLSFLQEHPSQVPLTTLDEPGLYADLSLYVSCEATAVQVSQDAAVVSLEREAPSWEGLRRDVPEELLLDASLKRVAVLGDWVRENAPARTKSSHQLRFVRTPTGWHADYQLPERLQEARE